MKKVMKYIIASTVFIMGSFVVNGDRANAGMRNRIVSFFRNLSCSNCLRREPLDRDIKVKVPSNLRAKANQLSRTGLRLGEDINGFDETNIRTFRNHHWYLQRRKQDGTSVTIVSLNKPKIIGINDDTVYVKYKDTSGKDAIIFHQGVPNWIKGEDIKNKLRDRRIFIQPRTNTNTINTVNDGIDNPSFNNTDE